MKKFKKIIVTVSSALLASTIMSSVQAKPVNVGKGVPDDLDACSLGEVSGLKSHESGFLAVRTSPTTQATVQYKINNGQQVWMCDQSKNGKWIGVVYSKKGIDCGLDKRGNYKGRCYQGWVSAKFIKVIAG